MADPPPMEKLVKAYVGLRDKKDTTAKEQKLTNAAITARMELISKEILRQLDNVLKVNSCSTDFGLAYKKKQEFINVDDWEKFLQYICDECLDALGVPMDHAKRKEMRAKLLNDVPWEFFSKSVSKTETMKHIEKTSMLPPGVKYTAEYIAQIRKN